MRVTVIIPVYNRQELGERALRSAIAQQVDSAEIVVVDDCSHPPFRLPPDIAENPNVRLIRNKANGGESVARNVGVAAAKGEWIAFLDSDDYWLVDTLRARLELAEKEFLAEQDIMTAYAAGFIVDNKRTGLRQARIPKESASPIDFASGCWFAPGSTMLCRKETMQRVGLSDPLLRRLQDLDWFLRFVLAGGRIKVWASVAAVVETGPKPSIASLEDSARHLKLKYSHRTSPHCLPPELIRRLEAYLDVERASVLAAKKRWLQMIYYLARSVWRAPRFRLPIEQFWRYEALPSEFPPSGALVVHESQAP
jgi:glycosyltransferase involved in cell wall biosynthesis